MNFTLPERFSDNTNELVTLLRHYDLSQDGTEKEKVLMRALATSCRLLSSIDLHALSDRIDEIFRDVETYERVAIRTKTWFDAMFGQASHFHKFLDETEDELLKGAGIQAENRKRILKKLRDLRKLAHSEAGNLTTKPIIDAIRALHDDVCKWKDGKVEAAQHLNARNKALKAALVGVIVANAAGQVLFPRASPADMAASVALGGVAQFRP